MAESNRRKLAERYKDASRDSAEVVPMNFDWKKIGLWGGGITAIGVIGYWLYQYQQTASANSAAQAAQDSQDQNQALAALMQESYTGDGGTAVSGPTVDTGSDSLQSLIASILNPPATAPTAPVTSPVTTNPTTPTTPLTPSTPINTSTGGPVSAPVGSGANPLSTPTTQPGYALANPSTQTATISPGRLYTMPVATSITQ